MISGIAEVAMTAETLRNETFDYIPRPFDFGYLQHLVALSLDT
jgi:FixJ family two-component response regulator